MSPTPKRQPMVACPHCGAMNDPARGAKNCFSCNLPLSKAIEPATSPFDAIKHTDERGEYWTARELMPLMGYTKWENFAEAMERAIISIGNIGQDPDLHFSRHQEKSRGPGRPPVDCRMTRFGAYITAQNGDPRKVEVAAAQAYFAIRTHEAETAAAAQSVELDELEVAERYVASLRRNKELATENAKLRVKAEAFDLWLNGKGCYLVGTVAKMLNLGPKALWDFLYAEKLIIKAPGTKRHREPYSRPDIKDWFEVEPVPPERANGHATKTTGVTPYGAEQIRLRLIKRGVLPPQQLALIEGSA